jgi:multisubunit Na+/H+ antiporter MnhC subunit
MEHNHNHNSLVIGFLICFFMVGIAVFLALTVNSIEVEVQSKLFAYGVALFLILAGIIMLKGVFKTRDECPICKDRYQWNRKK